MSIAKMKSGRLANKDLVSNDGVGVGISATSTKKVVFPPSYNAQSLPGNPSFVGGSDTDTMLTGAGNGETGGSGEFNPHRWGHTSPSGSRIEINDTGGAERVELVHSSGAAVVIEPDGSMFLNSTSARGAGLSAPKGDLFLSAGGDLVINGKGVLSINTTGDLNLNVGGTLNIICGAYKLQTSTMDEVIDGSASRAVTNDQSQVIGGINRKAVASDDREQVTGNKIVDVHGNMNTKIDGDNTNDVTGVSTHTIKGDHTLSTQAKTKILSGSDTTVDTGGKLDVKTSGTTDIDTGGNMQVISGADILIGASGNLFAGAQADTYVTSGATMRVNAGGAALLSGESQMDVTSGGVTKVGGTQVQNHGGTVANFCGTFLSKPISGDPGGPNPTTPPSPGNPPGPDGPAGPEGPKEAQTVEANDIVDELTSVRKYPQYKGNGRIESADNAALGMISGDTQPQAEDVYNEYSGKNQGSLNPSYSGGSYDTLPEEPVNRSPNIESVDPGKEVPAPHNPGAKISKYFTLGELLNSPLSQKVPPELYDSVVKNLILLANNVLDPIREKFPSMYVTNCFRTNSGNHITGRACDIQVAGKSLTIHAEIARFARDNLPVEKVLLEKSSSTSTHVHINVAPVGSKAAPIVYTCGDKKCNSKTPGIVVEYLMRKKKK